MTPTINPRKNSLSISLTESVVFLRSVDVSTHRPTTRENTPPSILRGLLILSLVKPTRISSIKVDFIGQSVTTWTEGTLSHLSPSSVLSTSTSISIYPTFLAGPSTRYPSELQEKINLYSATRTFFQAPRIPTSRRALSLEPGLAHYADEAEFINRRRPPSPPMARDPGPTHQFSLVDVPRGRERGRARLSVDDDILQRELPLESHSRSTPGLSPPSLASSEDENSVPPLHSAVHHLHAHPPHTSSRSALERQSTTISPPPTIDSPHESRSLSRTLPA
jgi:hypothetical protein